MANDQHVAMIKKGVDAWNRWRGENPDVVPDLSGENLTNAHLPRANLRSKAAEAACKADDIQRFKDEQHNTITSGRPRI
jgi:hypothetical protein